MCWRTVESYRRTLAQGAGLDKLLEHAGSSSVFSATVDEGGSESGMSANSMTPRQAAVALVAAMPTGVSVQQLEEYGIEATAEQAQAITQEVLSLNLFWIFAAIEAHIPQKYQSALSELILDAMEAGWGTIIPVGSAVWTTYLNEWQERRRRYNRLVEEGVSPLAVSAEAAALMEENRLVKEAERRNLLTLLIDFVPVDTYGRLLEDVG